MKAITVRELDEIEFRQRLKKAEWLKVLWRRNALKKSSICILIFARDIVTFEVILQSLWAELQHDYDLLFVPGAMCICEYIYAAVNMQVI